LDNKINLVKASIISSLGIILSLLVAYVPMLSLFNLIIPVPYAILGTVTDKKYSIISFIATFLILLILVNPIYSLSVCIMNIFPGLIIGSIAKKQITDENTNKFGPIYGGIVAVIIATIILFVISNVFFKINMLEDFRSMIKETAKIQTSILENAGVSIGEELSPDKIIDYIINMLPTILFLQAMITSFIIYYLEIFFVHRIRIMNIKRPKFTEFYLPGNAVIASLVLYILVFFMESININLYTDLIMFNLQTIFSFMFIIQGISVCFYYSRKWIKKGNFKPMLLWCLILSLFGFVAVSFIGMLDSINDFRKVKTYKSI